MTHDSLTHLTHFCIMPTSNKAKIASIYIHLKFGALPGLWTPGVTTIKA